MPPTEQSPAEAPFHEVEFEYEDPNCPVLNTSEELACSVTVLTWASSSEPDPYLRMTVSVSDVSAQTFIEAVHGHTGIDGVYLLRSSPDNALIELTVPDPHIPQFIQNGVSFLKSFEASEGVGRLVILLPNRRDPEAVARHLVRYHRELTLLDVRNTDIIDIIGARYGFRNLVENKLTDRQWTALNLAYKNGYFHRPRETSQAELAETMDISQETFSQHLLVAMLTVMDLVFSERWHDSAGGSTE